MQPRNNKVIVLVDGLVLCLLGAGWYYDNPSFVTPVLIFMAFVLSMAGLMIAAYFVPVNKESLGLAKLKALDMFWDRLDKQSTSEYIYDEVTDVAVVLMLWLAGAPVFSVLWAVVVTFKGYNRTGGARRRIIDQVNKFQASKDA